MATTTPERADRAEGDQQVVLRDVGWAGYTALLRLRGHRRGPRIVYLDGDAYLMSPSFPHERLAERLGMLVMVVVEELNIPCTPSGATTFRRRKKKGGAEPDRSYYLENEALVRGKDRLHLRHDPPPDLVIEAVWTHDPDPAVEVWRRFGVPEVWVCDGEALAILVRGEDGRYHPATTSRAFPFLTDAELLGWAARPQDRPETHWIQDVRRWVRDELAPRAGGAGPDAR